jgi:hypothetical protein
VLGVFGVGCIIHRPYAASPFRSCLSATFIIQARVPQGAITALLLFNICIANQPTSSYYILVIEYADKKAIPQFVKIQ